MRLHRLFPLVVALLVFSSPYAAALAQTKAPECGPDHAIIYKRAVALLDQADKKLTARYTAEAKSLVKESNSLFTILQKECGQTQKERELTPKETQQETINQKLSDDARAQGDRLMQDAAAKEKKAQEAENRGQKDLSETLQRQAKGEYERSHSMYIKAEIYGLRTMQMLFQFLAK